MCNVLCVCILIVTFFIWVDHYFFFADSDPPQEQEGTGARLDRTDDSFLFEQLDKTSKASYPIVTPRAK